MAKKAKKKLLKSQRAHLRKIGKKGGSVKGPTKSRTSEEMRRIVMIRWDRVRAEKEAKEKDSPPD